MNLSTTQPSPTTRFSRATWKFHKTSARTLLLVISAASGFPALAAVPLTFELRSAATAVAVQFDVAKMGNASFALSAPEVVMASPHAVESAVLPSGVTRFVVYSTGGQIISPSGKVRISFASTGPAVQGSLSVTGIVASNAAGQLVSSSPNALPVLAGEPLAYRSMDAGVASNFVAPVVDLDGSVASVDFRIGGVSRGVDTTAPFSLSWNPPVTGSLGYELVVTDAQGGSSTLNLGTLRLYNQSDLTTFAAYVETHYGPAANPNDYGFNADPVQTGTANGIGYLLGLNPYSPARSRLPQASVEFNGGQYQFVYRFTRRTTTPGVMWSVKESGVLAGWAAAANPQVTEIPLAGGLTEVTLRRPLGANPPAKLFMQLNAAQ